jgi:hypothetical protein
MQLPRCEREQSVQKTALAYWLTPTTLGRTVAAGVDRWGRSAFRKFRQENAGASYQKHALIEAAKIDVKPALFHATQICAYPTGRDLLIKVGISPLYSDWAGDRARSNKSATQKPVDVELQPTFKLGALA